MDNEEFIIMTCKRKIAYRNKKKAIYALAQVRKSFKLVAPTLQIYQCKICGLYHLGNSKRG